MKCNDGEFTKIIEWTPAYDRRHLDPEKNYGIHGMNLRFILSGPKGATQFLIYTNWMLLENRKRWDEQVDAYLCQPMPADVGYHAYTPQYDGQELISPSCECLDGKPCYYDGSGMNAEALFDEFVANGEDAVWAWLKEKYDDIGPKEVIP